MATTKRKVQTTPAQRAAAERDRVQAIRTICKAAKLDELADGYIKGGTSVETVVELVRKITEKVEKVDAALSAEGGRAVDISAVYRGRNAEHFRGSK